MQSFTWDPFLAREHSSSLNIWHQAHGPTASRYMYQKGKQLHCQYEGFSPPSARDQQRTWQWGHPET